MALQQAPRNSSWWQWVANLSEQLYHATNQNSIAVVPNPVLLLDGQQFNNSTAGFRLMNYRAQNAYLVPAPLQTPYYPNQGGGQIYFQVRK